MPPPPHKCSSPHAQAHKGDRREHGRGRSGKGGGGGGPIGKRKKHNGRGVYQRDDPPSSSDSEEENPQENKENKETSEDTSKEVALVRKVEELQAKVVQLEKQQSSGGNVLVARKTKGVALNTAQQTYLHGFVKDSLYSQVKMMTPSMWEDVPIILNKCCKSFSVTNPDEIAKYKNSVIKMVNERLMALRNANLTAWQRVYKGTLDEWQ